MADHDKGYKLLFSHAAMVADLLRGFVKEDCSRKRAAARFRSASSSISGIRDSSISAYRS